MPRTTLLRTLSFRAEHRYWRSDRSEDRNREVFGVLAGQDLNKAISEVRKGEILPSTEQLAGWLWMRLDGRIPGSARLRRVRVFESPDPASEFARGGDS